MNISIVNNICKSWHTAGWSVHEDVLCHLKESGKGDAIFKCYFRLVSIFIIAIVAVAVVVMVVLKCGITLINMWCILLVGKTVALKFEINYRKTQQND